MAPSLRDRDVLVVGAGKSGLSAARLLVRAGARVAVEDVRPAAELGKSVEELAQEGVKLGAGRALRIEALQGKHLVVVSPGVPLNQLALQEYRANGGRVVGEVELASWYLRPRLPLVGVTGTNGKSTTTALCGELLTQGGMRPFVGGNLGRPLSEAALSTDPFGAYVVELSSYQLEGLDQLVVKWAALTNLAPDHLDRYPSYEAYQTAKARIFHGGGAEAAAVVNLGDAAALEIALLSGRPIHGFSARADLHAELPAGRVAARAVPDPGGFWIIGGGGLCLEEAGSACRRAKSAGRSIRSTGGVLRTEHPSDRRFEVRTLALRGAHNLENAMAAALLARLCGVSDERIQRGLDSFPGLPHRLELVRTLNGVEWVNDSKATNVDSAVVALRAFAGQEVWLIAGGRGKGAPYAPLVEVGKGKVLGVLTIGADAPAVEKAFTGTAPVFPCETLERAVKEAFVRAQPSQAVLLSPACASFDQFKNFEDRGQTFRRLVEAL